MSRALILLTALLVLALPGPAHATAVDVSTLGAVNTAGSAPSGAWRQITLPANTRCVLVQLDGNGWVDGYGASLTDGASHGAGTGVAVTSATTVSIPLPASSRRQSVWAAGNGGARTITVWPFGAECQP